MQQVLLTYLGVKSSRHTYYDDDSNIEFDTLNFIRNLYHETRITFLWQTDDLLLLGNMLFTHKKHLHNQEKYLQTWHVLIIDGGLIST